MIDLDALQLSIRTTLTREASDVRDRAMSCADRIERLELLGRAAGMLDAASLVGSAFAGAKAGVGA